MKFTDKIGLLNILDIVKPAVSTKDFDSILKCFHFTKDGIEGYNGEIYIKAFYITNMDFLVPANIFYKLISEIPNNTEFEILIDETSIKVRVGTKIEAKFPLIMDYKFPLPEGNNIEDISFPLSKEVLEGLKICLEFIGKDETKPVFRGVYMNTEGIFATDGYRIAHYNIKFDGEIFLPEVFCQLLLKHKPEVFYQNKDNSSLSFNIPDVLIYSNKTNFGEALPNYLGIINSAKESSQDRFITITKDMIDAYKRVSIFTDGLQDKYCELKFDEKMVTIVVKNNNIGEIIEKFEIEKQKYEEEEVTIDLLLFQSILEYSKVFELSPKSETRGFPIIRGINDNLEIVQITLNMGIEK